LLIIVCTILILYLNSLSDWKHSASENSKTITILLDSINIIQTAVPEIKLVAPGIDSYEGEIAIKYKVKNGDTTSKIAQFFYNDWRMYRKIEADNYLTQNYILHVGQLLIIKLTK